MTYLRLIEDDLSAFRNEDTFGTDLDDMDDFASLIDDEDDFALLNWTTPIPLLRGPELIDDEIPF